jgi:hypothetical protein
MHPPEPLLAGVIGTAAGAGNADWTLQCTRPSTQLPQLSAIHALDAQPVLRVPSPSTSPSPSRALRPLRALVDGPYPAPCQAVSVHLPPRCAGGRGHGRRLPAGLHPGLHPGGAGACLRRRRQRRSAKRPPAAGTAAVLWPLTRLDVARPSPRRARTSPLTSYPCFRSRWRRPAVAAMRHCALTVRVRIFLTSLPPSTDPLAGAVAPRPQTPCATTRVATPWSAFAALAPSRAAPTGSRRSPGCRREAAALRAGHMVGAGLAPHQSSSSPSPSPQRATGRRRTRLPARRRSQRFAHAWAPTPQPCSCCGPPRTGCCPVSDAAAQVGLPFHGARSAPSRQGRLERVGLRRTLSQRGGCQLARGHRRVDFIARVPARSESFVQRCLS